MRAGATEPVRAAIVGLGWWGRTLVEAAAGGRGGLRFVRGVTLQPADAEAFADTHDLGLASSLDDVLADPDVEAVVLATPHSLHVPQIVAAAGAGRHVFSEKPLALDLAAGRRAVDACREAGVVLGLGTDKRFLPAVVELRRLVSEGCLGRVLHIEGQYSNDNSLRGVSGSWRASPDEAPAAGLTGPGLHILDLIVDLGGPVGSVDARLLVHADPPGSVDSIAAVFDLASGATAALSSVRGTPEFMRLQVLGTEGWAEVRDFGEIHVRRLGGDVESTAMACELAVDHLLGCFARSVRTGEAFPVSPESMIDTVAAFEATATAAEQQRRVAVGHREGEV